MKLPVKSLVQQWKFIDLSDPGCLSPRIRSVCVVSSLFAGSLFSGNGRCHLNTREFDWNVDIDWICLWPEKLLWK